jgi:hypothetical protein
MPFDPKLIQPDDAPLRDGGEIDLPADLAALGEQLRDDALHLAALYPTRAELAANRPEPASARRSPGDSGGGLRVWKKVAVLAGSALATVLAGVVAMQMMTSPRANLDVAEAPPARRNNSHEPAAEISTTISPGPTISLTELSGPELEALLDLWQREPARAEGTGVSF